MKEPSLILMVIASFALHCAFFALLAYFLSVASTRMFIYPGIQVELLGQDFGNAVSPKKSSIPPSKRAMVTSKKLTKAKPNIASGTKKKIIKEPLPKESSKKTMIISKKELKLKKDALKTKKKPVKPKLEKEKVLDEKLDIAVERIKGRLAKRSLKGLPEGAFISGMSRGGPIDVQVGLYISEVWQRLMTAFRVPPVLMDKKYLEAIVVLKIGRNGDVMDVKIEESSSNTIYDETVLRTIKAASPFPSLPTNIKGSFFELGVRFRQEDLQQWMS